MLWYFAKLFRDSSPTPPLNLFTTRARRYSTGFSPLATNPGPMPRLTPRVSQLRQEESGDINTREMNHERELHTAHEISQSCEDLSIDDWSFKSDDLTNQLHVTLPTNVISCSSPSPTRYIIIIRFGFVYAPKSFSLNYNSFDWLVAELAYGFHMDCHHHRPAERSKHGAVCHRSHCDRVHLDPSNENLN